ncbi:hypothetical protein CUV01_19445 (plasmid) [Paracoccus tegillarcae]|uniref:Uncharacterized protein n=1 Tax=Paracoccus tegillarcae TaxID=1529068 RepID=A0A2K9EMU8_9RHOB|nr:hypothetical protein CUV01_19445 [Paracoccus tegillarcae]
MCVELDEPLKDWFELIGSLSKQDVKDQIGSHFLHISVSRLPEIFLQFDDDEPKTSPAISRQCSLNTLQARSTLLLRV